MWLLSGGDLYDLQGKGSMDGMKDVRVPLRARPTDSEAGQALVYKGLMHTSPNHPPTG